MKKITMVLMALLFLFTSTTFAADNSSQVDALIKAAEKQAAALSPQLNNKDPKSIKPISTKTLSTLSLSINNAKKALKTNKGKQKASFEKRIRSLEQLIARAQSFNNAITQGEKLLIVANNFNKLFAAKPFTTEKAYKELKKQNDQYTKILNTIGNKDTQSAFGMKYQRNIEITLDEMPMFFTLNKRLDSFLAFTEENEDSEVWDEFYAIHESIANDLTSITTDLIFNKFYTIYYDAFIAPEEESINTFLSDFYFAINNKDAEAFADLYLTETEEERKDFIKEIETYFQKMPDNLLITIESVEIEFCYNGEAYVFIEEMHKDSTVESVSVYLKKIKGKWMIIPEQTEKSTATNPASF